MYFPAPLTSSKQIIVPLKHSSMLPQNKNRLIFGRAKDNWHWTLCHSLPLPSKHLCFSKTSWRRLQHNNFLSSKTSSGRVCNTSSTNVFKTFSKCLQDVFSTCLQDVFFKSSWRGLQDIFMKTSCSYVLKTYALKDKKMLYCRSLQYVFTKTNVWWVSLSGLSVAVCSVILHHKHSRRSSNLCWSLPKATSANIIIVNMVKVSLGQLHKEQCTDNMQQVHHPTRTHPPSPARQTAAHQAWRRHQPS